MDLSDQVAIVTGGGRGIGREIALALVRAGARVAIVSRSRSELQETVRDADDGRSRLLAAPGDMTDLAGFRRIVARVDDLFGPISLLVNNAAVYTPGEPPLWEADLAAWWRTFDVNVRGPLTCTHAALPTMISAGRGRVITVGSGSGVEPFPLTSYSFSKSALVRFTETLAASLTTSGSAVTTFVIDPGTVRTTLTESFAAAFPDQVWTPAELSSRLVVSLASGRYDALTGRYLSVADDLDALLARIDEIKRNELYVLRLRTFGSDRTDTVARR